ALDVTGAALISSTLGVTGDTTLGTLGISGLATFDSVPTGTGVGQGSVYINPASATADYTLLGLAVNGDEKFKVDEDGDLTAGTVTGTKLYMTNPTDNHTSASADVRWNPTTKELEMGGDDICISVWSVSADGKETYSGQLIDWNYFKEYEDYDEVTLRDPSNTVKFTVAYGLPETDYI
ncbi:unnamed protein product, partial [marine sediment metagenome]